MSWTRLCYARRCGFCGHVVPAEAPIYKLSCSPSCRCEDCAERYFRTSAPADLAPVAPLPVYVSKPSAFVPVGVVARSYDARMVGEREPGEEG